MNRRCPRCLNEMNPFVYQDVEVDFCGKCGCSWFDEREISEYFLTKRDLPGNSVLIVDYDENGPRCPKDGGLLQQYRYTSMADLIIDVCPYCRGVLLDRGEIKRLEELAKHIPDTMVSVIQRLEFKK